jgi:hypothetical protein
MERGYYSGMPTPAPSNSAVAAWHATMAVFSSKKKYCAKKRFLVTSNLRYMHGVLNIDEIKN